MAHGVVDEVGDWWNRNIRNPIAEGYFGYHRGPDWLAEATIGSNTEMRTELFGGGDMSDFNDMLATYEETGDLPGGRAGEVLQNLADIREATMGEFDIKDLIAGEKTSSAESAFNIAESKTDLLRTGYDELDLQEKGVSGWLETNMMGVVGGQGQTFQKTGGISGPTRGATMKKKSIMEAGKDKYAGINIGRTKLGQQIEISEEQEDIAQNTWDIAGYGEDLLGAERDVASASMDQDRTNAMNQIKDLLYELETSEIQFG